MSLPGSVLLTFFCAGLQAALHRCLPSPGYSDPPAPGSRPSRLFVGKTRASKSSLRGRWGRGGCLDFSDANGGCTRERRGSPDASSHLQEIARSLQQLGDTDYTLATNCLMQCLGNVRCRGVSAGNIKNRFKKKNGEEEKSFL